MNESRSAAQPERLLNQPSSHARGRIRSEGNPLYRANPILGDWAKHQPALPFSYRQPTTTWHDLALEPKTPDWITGTDPALHENHKHYSMSTKGRCLHPACQRAVAAIAETQRMPQTHTRYDGSELELRPYTTYSGFAGDPPTEFVTAKRQGAALLSLDIPQTVNGGLLADVVTDEGFVPVDDRNPYLLLDPETRSQIAMEQSMHLSGPVSRYHRKWSRARNAEFVAIDRWGRQYPDENVVVLDENNEPITDRALPIARCWHAMAFRPDPPGTKPVIIDERDIGPEHLEVAFVFEAQQPLDYKAVRDAYIDRIVELTGTFHSWADQQHLRAEGAIARLERQAWPVVTPIGEQIDTDPFRYRYLDLDIHEPHETYDVSELIDTDELLRDYPGRTLDTLRAEEIDEYEATIIAELKAAGTLLPFTTYHLRGHSDWQTACEARLHANGAEYLASDEDAIEFRSTFETPVAERT